MSALRRDVGALDAALVTVGAMIGSGIFYTPAEVARATGTTARALAAWALGAALSLLGALTLAEPGAAITETGGLYVYLRRAFGPAVAFLFGWAMLAVLVPSSVAFFAGVTARHVAPLVGVGERPLALALVAFVALVNVVGVRRAARLQSLTAALKYLGVAAVALAAFAAGAPAHAAPSVAKGSVVAAVVPALWAYDGWIDVTSIAGEVRDPAKTIPRALVLGTVAVAAVYLAVAFAYHHALGSAVLAAAEAPGNALGARVAGAAGMRAVGALVAVSCFGGCMIGMLTGTRVVAAMGDAGGVLRGLAATGRAGTPDRAIVVTALLAAAYGASAQLGRLAEVFVVGAWPFYALGALAVVALRRREPELVRPYRVPGYPWTPLAFFAATVGMLASFARASPALVAKSFGLIALGLPLYALGRPRGLHPRSPSLALTPSPAQSRQGKGTSGTPRRHDTATP
ncbi:MAG: amino acid permease [Polyangiales bacterium]